MILQFCYSRHTQTRGSMLLLALPTAQTQLHDANLEIQYLWRRDISVGMTEETDKNKEHCPKSACLRLSASTTSYCVHLPNIN
ncbi:hypothetical protein P8452_44925 [Trifolium repens]|nr:hypothetical protein P8452_44925 [Trifolium repens]